MTPRFTLKLALVGSLAWGASAWATGPTPAMLAQSCAACHGPSGSSVGVTPSIAGADKEYFMEAMKGFKDGTRKATVMDRIAKGYTDKEIEKMAQYFGKQQVVAMKQTYSDSKAKLGSQLHKEYCEKCHEEGGRKSEDSAVLAGQSMLYLNYSMEDFKAGHREAPKKMRSRVEKVIEKHGAAGLDALIHYYASQQ